MPNFPTTLDTLTNPTATDYLNSPSHAGQHATANDILEALETKVGITGVGFNPASADASASVVLHEDTKNGTNKVTLIAPSAIASDKTLTLPDETGTVLTSASASQVLQASGGTDATTSSSTASDLDGCSITLTTTTKPVLIIGSMNIQGNGSGLVKVLLDKDGSTVAYHTINCVNAEKRCLTFSYVDTPTAASHTYKLRWLSDNNSTMMSNLPGSDGSLWWRRITLMEVGN